MDHSVSQASAIGTREVNEDRVGVAEGPESTLLVIADGMGGYARGDLAAETLVETSTKAFLQLRGRTVSDPEAFLVLTLLHAHRMINRRAAEAGISVSQPRTTAVVCLVQRGYAYWAHVGDSRLYLIRDGTVASCTVDHTTHEQLRRYGAAGAEPGLRGQLVRCLGGPTRPPVTVSHELVLDRGDLLLLVTDGVWRHLRPAQIARPFDGETLDGALDELVHQAERHAGRECDNMSAVAYRWASERTADPPPVRSRRVRDLDQGKLWREAQRRARRRRALGRSPAHRATPPTTEAGGIDATIEELEAFVEEVDRLL